MPKAQKHCKLQCFRAWQTQKNSKHLAKSVQNGPPKRTSQFFFHPEPRKTCKPHQPEGFWGRVAAEARPRVAKAMLSNHHCTARHRRIQALTPPCRRPQSRVEGIFRIRSGKRMWEENRRIFAFWHDWAVERVFLQILAQGVGHQPAPKMRLLRAQSPCQRVSEGCRFRT